MLRDHDPNRYPSRIKSSSLGPSSSRGATNQEGIPCGFGSVKDLVESYEGIPLKEQLDTYSKMKQIRQERQKEINDMLLLTKQQHLIGKAVAQFGADEQDIYVYGENEDDEEEEDEDNDEEERILSDKDQLEQSLLLVEEQEKKAEQFFCKGTQPQLSRISEEKTENSCDLNNNNHARFNQTDASPINACNGNLTSGKNNRLKSF